MKKVISLILISVMLITVSTAVLATNGDLGNNAIQITDNEYQNAQKETGNNTNSNTSLPQTGVEDFWAPIALMVFAASAVFAYKKVSYYRGV